MSRASITITITRSKHTLSAFEHHAYVMSNPDKRLGSIDCLFEVEEAIEQRIAVWAGEAPDHSPYQYHTL